MCISAAALAIFVAVMYFVFKGINAYNALCCILSAVMVAVSLISSFIYFNSKAASFEKYYEAEHDIEALVVSTRYDENNVSGYNVIVYRINGEKTYHKAVFECSYDSVLEPGFSFNARVSGHDFSMKLGSYDQKISMNSDDIFILYSSDEESDYFITNEESFHPEVLFANLNLKISMRFRAGLEKDAAALSSALLLGNKKALPNEVTRDFSRAGASHILALSGMHMSIIMGFCMLLLKALRVRRKVIAVILTAFALFYLLLTGSPISAARSVIMLLCVYLSILCGKRRDPLTSLSLAGAALMLLYPGCVIDAGFWMSYSATLGLIVYLPAFHRFMQLLILPLKESVKLILKPVTYLASSVMAGVFAILPITAVLCVFIKEISLFSVISSVALSIPAAGMIFMSLIYLPLSYIPALGAIVAGALNFLSGVMIDYCAAISDIEHAVVSVNYPFAAAFAIIFAVAIIYSLASKHKNVIVSLTPFVVSLVIFVASIFIYNAMEAKNIRISYVNPSTRSDMLVISNGDDAVICDFGSGSGKSYNQAFSAVYDAHVTEIRAIMLTRCTSSHYGTLYDVFTQEKVRELWLPVPLNEEEYNRMVPLTGLAAAHGVDVYVYSEDDGVSLFRYTGIQVSRYLIDRSVVPISVVTVTTRSNRLTYCAPAFNECEEADSISALLARSNYIIFGNSGPKTKIEYTIPEENKTDLIIFSDETRAAYFNRKNIGIVTFYYVPESCNITVKE